MLYRLEFVRCGKRDCGCHLAGGRRHGPYWYGYWRPGAMLLKRYIGKQLPGLRPGDTIAHGSVRVADVAGIDLGPGPPVSMGRRRTGTDGPGPLEVVTTPLEPARAIDAAGGPTGPPKARGRGTSKARRPF